jgi:cation diffusion facilitator CzcD-associated flavoprotein CzcO
VAVNTKQRIAIIGSGFSGLAMALRLKQEGIDSFTLFERADEIGGTWRDNTYPGCACDIPSHLYSLSFAPNPDWSRKYSPWNEIQEYLLRLVEENDLRRHVRFGADITEARFDAAESTWTLETASGEQFTADFLVSGTGALNKAILPAIPGIDDFEGPSFHSSAWDHEVDLTGKRVAVIGTGASAIQIVPGIVDQVERLDLYQRTPPWVVPRWDHTISRFSKALFRTIPPTRWLYRNWLYWYQEFLGIGFVTNMGLHKVVEKLGRWNMNRAVESEELREALSPDYRIGCKRILVSDDYYPALAREQVEVITDGVERITPRGVVTASGEREVDAIVYATGFITTEFVTPMKVDGLEGRELGEAWQSDTETYLGMTVAGYPNLFLLFGPNTGLGHNSALFMIEAQVNYIARCLKAMGRSGAKSVDVRSEVQKSFNERIQKRMKNTTWLSGCRSWYLTESGKNITLWPGFTVSYWLKTRRFDAADYHLR